jgi:polyisoprenoid-binding protein YceI
MKTRLLTAALVLFATMGFAQVKWEFDKSHTEISFNVTHLVISEVTGYFREYDGTVVANNDDFDNSEITFTAQIGSIDTDNAQRDGHLKSDDFFNAEKFPQLMFKGNLVKVGGSYKLKGDLTIRDITKPVEFNVAYNGTITDPWGNVKSGFKINGTINRFDYNLKWNALMEAGGAVVGEEVEIVVKTELLQKQA